MNKYIYLKRKDGNLPGYETDMPVKVFLDKLRRIDLKVAGLLDYGYDELQVSQMLNIPLRQVQNLMSTHSYKTVDRLPS